MIDKTSPAQGYEENLSRLKHRIEILERSLQREQAEKKRLELELHTIKSSLAWLAIIKYRGLRDWLFPTGTRRRNLYGIIKAVLKDRVWNKDARSDLSLGHLPGLLRQVLNVSSTGCGRKINPNRISRQRDPVNVPLPLPIADAKARYQWRNLPNNGISIVNEKQSYN